MKWDIVARFTKEDDARAHVSWLFHQLKAHGAKMIKESNGYAVYILKIERSI